MKIYIIVCSFILGDIITGLIKAIYKEGLNSTILRKGLFHKLSELLAMLLCSGIEYATNFLELGIEIPAAKVVAAYISLMETISIIENISIMNPGLSKFFSPYIEKLRGADSEKRN